jgi:O-acetyl-ADP-ribose deacetylase
VAKIEIVDGNLLNQDVEVIVNAWNRNIFPGAVLTSAGDLKFKAIIHVAGINLFWMGSDFATSKSTKNALELAQKRGFSSIAFPTIGAGTGGVSESNASPQYTEAYGRENERAE